MAFPTREEFMSMGESDARAAEWDMLARIHTIVVKLADKNGVSSINQESQGGNNYPVYGGNATDRNAGENYKE
jgi:hypothetical protein